MPAVVSKVEIHPNCVVFGQNRFPFSEDSLVKFEFDGVTYVIPFINVILFLKASAFPGNEELAKQILETQNVSEVRKLTKKIKNFNAVEWKANCFDILYGGISSIILSSPKLINLLLSTGDKQLYYAVQLSTTLSVGLGYHTIDAADPEKHVGANVWGRVLMKMRGVLMSDGHKFDPDGMKIKDFISQVEIAPIPKKKGRPPKGDHQVSEKSEEQSKKKFVNPITGREINDTPANRKRVEDALQQKKKVLDETFPSEEPEPPAVEAVAN